MNAELITELRYCANIEKRKLLSDAADALEAAEKRIAELEAQMPKRGEWIRHGTDEDEFCYYECPLCGFIGIDWNYCPNCGARMDGKEHNDEQADC
jgi:rubrerythrin